MRELSMGKSVDVDFILGRSLGRLDVQATLAEGLYNPFAPIFIGVGPRAFIRPCERSKLLDDQCRLEWRLAFADSIENDGLTFAMTNGHCHASRRNHPTDQ